MVQYSHALTWRAICYGCIQNLRQNQTRVDWDVVWGFTHILCSTMSIVTRLRHSSCLCIVCLWPLLHTGNAPGSSTKLSCKLFSLWNKQVRYPLVWVLYYTILHHTTYITLYYYSVVDQLTMARIWGLGWAIKQYSPWYRPPSVSASSCDCFR